MGERAESGLRVGAEQIRAVWVAYHFPPIGGAGTQRSLKFVAHLPEFGIEPVVVTGPGDAEGRWTPHDESLLAEVPSNLEVHRIPGPEPRPTGGGWAGRRERWFHARSEWSRWWRRGAVEALSKLDGIDLIHASMSPFETGEVAAEVAARKGIPWVAGLRDPWALDEMMIYPTRLHRSLELARMRRVLSSAAAIVLTAPEAAARVLRAFPELADRPVVSITNGFDAADFPGPAARRDDGTFRIVHTGYLHSDSASQRGPVAHARRLLGGEIGGVEVGTRSHIYLLAAVDRLLEDDPELRGVVELHLAGVLSPVDRDVAARFECVRLHGYLPHAESTQLLRTADLLFLPMQNVARGVRPAIIPGKTYEYLATGRPILAAVPAGDAREIVLDAGTGLVCDPDDVSRMVSILKGEVERWRRRAPFPPLDRAYLARFERRALTGELVRVLHAAAAPRAQA